MYDELVKSLRVCAVDGSCRTCPRFLICDDEKGSVLAGLFNDAADAIEELICEVADEHNARLDVEERHRWIPVTERLPENCKYVLAYIERNSWLSGGVGPYRKREIANAYHVNGLWHVDGRSGVVCIAWMPLPEPPKKEIE